LKKLIYPIGIVTVCSNYLCDYRSMDKK
jgi:hypothetical protein